MLKLKVGRETYNYVVINPNVEHHSYGLGQEIKILEVPIREDETIFMPFDVDVFLGYEELPSAESPNNLVRARFSIVKKSEVK